MIRKDDCYRIGRIGKPHGVKGEITFHFSDDVFDRVNADYIVIEVEGILVPFFIEEYRFRSDETALMKMLTNSEVYFERSLSDEDEEPTMAAIVGYRLFVDEDGTEIGEIIGIDDTTANTLFEVKRADARGKNPVLIPVAEEFIKGIDNDKREIRVALPEGLLEL